MQVICGTTVAEQLLGVQRLDVASVVLVVVGQLVVEEDGGFEVLGDPEEDLREEGEREGGGAWSGC